jgi:Domain of unknown function (DUF4386)
MYLGKERIFMISNPELGGFPPKRMARLLGFLGLAGILTGAFDIGYVQSKLIVAGNSSATLNNILIHPHLFRIGFSAHLFEMVINIFAELIGFLLLRRVNVFVAGVALSCGIVGITIESIGLLNAYLPLKLAMESGSQTAFSHDQLLELFHLSVQMQQAGLLLSWVFYGVDELTTGFLIFRSGFLPRILGILLSLSGLCYFTHGMLSFLAPSLDAKLYPYILFPCLPGEGLTSLWFAIMGLNVVKWKAWGDKPDIA